MNPIRFLSKKINAKEKTKYDILTFSTHESYQEALARTGHNFYLLELDGAKKWNSDFRKIPSNCTIINNTKDIPSKIDFILSQERYGQLQFSLDLSNSTRLPVLHIDHVEPVGDERANYLRSLKADKHVFITEHNRTTWGVDGDVIRHGIDTEVFNGWKPNKSKKVVYTVNYLKDRDFFCGWTEWEKIKSKVQSIDPAIEFHLIGDNPGISKTISDPKQLASELCNFACYLNTSKYSPIPMSLLEAMSCAMPIVSTKYQEVGKVLNENNSIASNDLDTLSAAIIDICNDNESYSEIGCSARGTIEELYSMNTFIESWNAVFKEVYKIKLGAAHEIHHIK